MNHMLYDFRGCYNPSDDYYEEYESDLYEIEDDEPEDDDD